MFICCEFVFELTEEIPKEWLAHLSEMMPHISSDFIHKHICWGFPDLDGTKVGIPVPKDSVGIFILSLLSV